MADILRWPDGQYTTGDRFVDNVPGCKTVLRFNLQDRATMFVPPLFMQN